MKKRDTETYHHLADEVFNNINIFDLQGLLINKNNEFSAAIEAFELSDGEEFHLDNAFSNKEWVAKILLAEKLDIPFYLVVHPYQSGGFLIYEVGLNSSNRPYIMDYQEKDYQAFAEWWASLKGTIQTKALNEAGARIADSTVDEVIESAGLSWGGNVDGFIVLKESDIILGIVEKRVSHRKEVTEYNPANYFNYRGGDYNTWLPLVKLANQLNCPLFLMTFNIRDNTRIGISVISGITRNSLEYHTNPPNENIFTDITEAKKWMLTFMNLPKES